MKKQKKFKYRLVPICVNSFVESYEKWLNFLGEKGWELVCELDGTVPLNEKRYKLYIFKREF